MVSKFRALVQGAEDMGDEDFQQIRMDLQELQGRTVNVHCKITAQRQSEVYAHDQVPKQR
jgi:hypothetical protein